MTKVLGFVLLLTAYGIGYAVAAEPTACELKVAETMMQAHNLDTDRDTKEQKLAREQVKNYQLQQRVIELEKELAALKAPQP